MIICWWSAGVTSAVATKLAIDEFGKENVYFEKKELYPKVYVFLKTKFLFYLIFFL